MNKSANIPEIIAGGIVNDKAINLVLPAVKDSAFSWRVHVEVLIDEDGKVIAASYVAGNPALKAKVEEAARESKFAPTVLLGKSVKVKGIITYELAAHPAR